MFMRVAPAWGALGHFPPSVPANTLIANQRVLVASGRPKPNVFALSTNHSLGDRDLSRLSFLSSFYDQSETSYSFFFVFYVQIETFTF